MSDTETTVDDVTTDVDTEIDTTDDTAVELTVDDYNKEKARREKAEKALVELKRKTKDLESKSSESGEFITKADLAMDKFIDKNPDLVEYRDELASYQAKGIPLEKAKLLVEADDKTIANREKLGKTRVSDTEFSASKSEYTKAELNSLSDDNYNKVASQIKSGKIKLK